MECPTCQRPMTEGSSTVEGTFLGFLFVGLSHQHLWFEPGELNGTPIDGKGHRKFRVLPSNRRCSAWHCFGCRTTVLWPPRSA